MSGYSLPLSPSGRGALIAPPPWHFSGDVIWVDFQADPAAVAAFLPAGLEVGEAGGACALSFFDWQWCSALGEEHREPGTCQFKECLLLVGCSYRGRPAARMPYVWVDRAVPLVRGWIQGVPKLPGFVDMTHTVAVGRAGGHREHGGQFAATLAAAGRRLVEVDVTLTDAGASPPLLDRVPVINTRVFPSWDPDDAPVHELVCSVVEDREYSPIWRGAASLRFVDVDDDLAMLAPTAVGDGYVYSYAETVIGGHRLDA